MQARKKYDVQYPALYATAENCPNEANRAAFNVGPGGVGGGAWWLVERAPRGPPVLTGA
jgi:hypothetical protein